MSAIRTIQASAALIALAGCVHTSSLFDDPLLPAGGTVLALSEHAASGDSARLERTGFLERLSAAHGAYFITPEEIARINPRTISDIFRHVPVLIETAGPTGMMLRGSQGCLLTYANGMLRGGRAPGDLDTFIPAKDGVAA